MHPDKNKTSQHLDSIKQFIENYRRTQIKNKLKDF